MSMIELQSVSKRYHLHHGRLLLAKQVATRLRREAAEFWALRNVNLRVEAGETVGLIGANGAGKSTLLNIVAGVTSATEGSVQVAGRVAALLELGSGFHPDLTGRENIHLNAALLGYSRRQTRQSIDSIIDFAGVAEFIDEPLRTYSSGMTARLGFAVAIHLQSEILILDEVLAVGDQAFQNQCIDKIHAFRRQGKTLLFASHAPGFVEDICQRVLWLESGRLRRDGPAREVLAAYSQSLAGVSVASV